MKKLLVGNWKMNQNTKSITSFFSEFNSSFTNKRDAWIAPQSIYISKCVELSQGKVQIGAQNSSEHSNGAFTGEIATNDLLDIGAYFVILGHSERRQYFAETSKTLNLKIKKALKDGLKVIYCVGETLTQRESNETLTVIADQLHQGLTDLSEANELNLIIAYEPVWAIGTGKTATPAQAQEVHAFIRSEVKNKFPNFGEQVKVLYGGSVKPDNVEELLGQKDIDGGLVGGASMKAKDFLALCGDK